MLEFIFELLFEFLIQIVGQMLVELGLRAASDPFKEAPNPFLSALAYTLFGALLGAISLIFFPHHMVHAPFLRIVNLIFTPLAAGLCMSLLGAWRSNRGQTIMRMDRFAYGALFALACAMVRFIYAS